MTLLGVSLLLYQRVGVHSSFWTLLPSMILGGIGMALTMSPMTSAAMGVGAGRQGRRRLRRPEQLPPGRRLARHRGDGRDRRLVHLDHAGARRSAAPQDYVNGLHAALAVGAVITFAGGGRRRGHACGRAPAASSARTSRRWPHDASPPPRMPAAERRQALIETAIRVFSEGSYRGTTTAEIARAAGVSEPILYRHFASKRDLYLAALDHVWGEGARRWERALAEATDVVRGVRGDRPRPRLRARLQVPDRGALGAGAGRGRRGPRAAQAPPPAHARGARLHRRPDPPRPGRRASLHADRDADAEAWTLLAGGVLGMVGRRIGLLDEDEVQRDPRSPPRLADGLTSALSSGSEPAARRRDRALAGAHATRSRAREALTSGQAKRGLAK